MYTKIAYSVVMWRKEDIIEKIVADKGDQSLRAYASTVGCSPMYISDILNNRRDPGPRLLNHLGIEREITKTIVYKPKKKWRKNE